MPGDDIKLTATPGEAVRLTWETEGAYDKYIVYRDGVKIAITTEPNFTDKKAIGKNSYTVQGIYGDYYTVSNPATAKVTVKGIIVCAEDDDEWIALKYVATSDRNNVIEHNQNVSYQQYSGAVYPMAVIGTSRQKNYAFAVAFKDVAPCKEFEALLGKVVTLKDQWQNVITGVLDGYMLDSTRFYQAYSCTIQQVE